MKFYSRKIAAIGLVAALVSLAGWFCVNPPSHNDSLVNASSHSEAGRHYINSISHSVLDVCAVNDCLSKLPQTLVAKKFSVNFYVSFLASIFTITLLTASLHKLAFVSEVSRAGPAVPDILSSVFKKE